MIHNACILNAQRASVNWRWVSHSINEHIKSGIRMVLFGWRCMKDPLAWRRKIWCRTGVRVLSLVWIACWRRGSGSLQWWWWWWEVHVGWWGNVCWWRGFGNGWWEVRWRGFGSERRDVIVWECWWRGFGSGWCEVNVWGNVCWWRGVGSGLCEGSGWELNWLLVSCSHPLHASAFLSFQFSSRRNPPGVGPGLQIYRSLAKLCPWHLPSSSNVVAAACCKMTESTVTAMSPGMYHYADLTYLLSAVTRDRSQTLPSWSLADDYTSRTWLVIAAAVRLRALCVYNAWQVQLLMWHN